MPTMTQRDQTEALAVVRQILAAEPRPIAPAAAPLDLQAQLAPVRSVTLLVIGPPLADDVASALRSSSVTIHEATSLVQGVHAMSAALYDVVALDPDLGGDGLGVRFVRCIKHADVTALPNIGPLMATYQPVPFVILPLAGDTQYAVFRRGADWYLADSRQASVTAAILQCARDIPDPSRV